MSLADNIRSFVIETRIKPARAAGSRLVKIRVGDVHDEMGLRNRLPAVAAALGSRKLEILANVHRVAIEGPSQGANCVFTFELLSGNRPVNNSIRREPAAETTSGELTIQQSHVEDLLAGFPGYLALFQREDVFSGPSIYFHQKTRYMLDRFRFLSDCDAQAVAACIDDDVFLECLYATLTAWGLHRMGPRGAKLAEFKDYTESLRRHREAVCGLASRRISELRDDEVDSVAEAIWRLIPALKIGSPRTTIVSGSKAIHHLLPDLVPPIDRAYTLRFFFGRRVLSEAEEEPAFHLMYPHFRHIAVACKGGIDKRLAQPTQWDTSITKVIDNAIVGYMRAHRSAKPSDE